MRPNFEVVDYSEKYFHGIKKMSLPSRWGGKFVQICNGKTEFIIFAPKEFAPYHADIVRCFCDERGVDGTYNSSKKKFDIIDTDWTIAGGGKFEIDMDLRTLRLFDDSMVYGKYDRRGLMEKLARDPKYIEYSFTIE